MKKNMFQIIIITSLIFITGVSCIKEDFDKPPVNIPKVDFTSNTTIAELKSLFNNNLDSISEDIIIQGVIIANDESGNLYKTLFIRDNSAGIEIKIDKTGLYNEYKIGQRVFVKCQGMYIGKYGGMQQLGYMYNNSIGRLPDILISKHLYKDSLPGPKPQPQLVSIPEITSQHIGTLIRLDSVYFETPGLPFAEQTTTNRILKDMSDNSILVRTSNYADFSSNFTPQGIGSIVGILSVFNNDLQLYIRSLEDILNFDQSTQFPQIIFSDNFDAPPSSNWNIVNVASNKTWTHNSSEKCMVINGFGADVASEDWLITKQISLVGVNEPTLQFRSWTRYTDTGFQFPLKAYISSDYAGSGNPNEANWIELQAIFPIAHSQTWTSSGIINIEQYTGQHVYFAFKYVSSGTSSNSSSEWKVDEVQIKGIF